MYLWFFSFLSLNNFFPDLPRRNDLDTVAGTIIAMMIGLRMT